MTLANYLQFSHFVPHLVQKKNLLSRQLQIRKCGRPNQIVPSKLTDLIVTVNQLGNRKSRLFMIANIASGAKSLK